MAVVLDAMVPDALPHLYVIVWVKLLDARLIVRVCFVFRVPFPALKDDFRGIVVRA